MFKVNDKVRCIYKRKHNIFIYGKIYTIVKIDKHLIDVKGESNIIFRFSIREDDDFGNTFYPEFYFPSWFDRAIPKNINIKFI